MKVYSSTRKTYICNERERLGYLLPLFLDFCEFAIFVLQISIFRASDIQLVHVKFFPPRVSVAIIAKTDIKKGTKVSFDYQDVSLSARG